MIRASRFGKKCLASLVCGSLILTAPGFECYLALAQEWTGAPTESSSGKVVEVLQVKPSGALSPLGAPNASVSTSFGILKPSAVSSSRPLAALPSAAANRTAASALTFTQQSFSALALPSRPSPQPSPFQGEIALETALQQLEAPDRKNREIKAGVETRDALISASYDGGDPARMMSANGVLAEGEFRPAAGAIAAKRFAWIGRGASFSTYPQADRDGVIIGDSAKAITAAGAPVHASHRSILFPIAATLAALGVTLLTVHGSVAWIVATTFLILRGAYAGLELWMWRAVVRNDDKIDPAKAQSQLEADLYRWGFHPSLISILTKDIRFFTPRRPLPLEKMPENDRPDLSFQAWKNYLRFKLALGLKEKTPENQKLESWLLGWKSYLLHASSFGLVAGGIPFLRPGLFAVPAVPAWYRRWVIEHEVRGHYVRDRGRAPPEAPSPLAGPWLSRACQWLDREAWNALKHVGSELRARYFEFRPGWFKSYQYSPLIRTLEQTNTRLDLAHPYRLLLASLPPGFLQRLLNPRKRREFHQWLDQKFYNELSRGQADISYLQKSASNELSSTERLSNLTAVSKSLNDPKNHGRFQYIVLPADQIGLPKKSSQDGRQLTLGLRKLHQFIASYKEPEPDDAEQIGPGGFLPQMYGSPPASQDSKRAGLPGNAFELKFWKFWAHLARTAFKGIDAVNILNGAYRSLENGGKAIIPWEESDSGVEPMDKLLRYWRGEDGGRFDVERVDLPEGGHVFVVTKDEPVVELHLNARNGFQVKISKQNVSEDPGDPASREKAFQELRKAGFGEEEIAAIWNDWKAPQYLELIEAGYSKDQIVYLFSLGMEVRSVNASDYNRETQLVVTVPSRNTGAAMRFAQKERIGFRISRNDAQVHIFNAAPQHEFPPVWQAGITGGGIKAVLLDTSLSVRPDHPDIVEKLLKRGLPLINVTNDGTKGDPQIHGSFTWGEVAAKALHYDPVMLGMAHDADVWMIQVFGGKGGASDGHIEAGAARGAQISARAANLSLGQEGPVNNPLSDFLSHLAKTAKIVMTISNGNAGPWSYMNNMLVNGLYTLGMAALINGEYAGIYTAVGPSLYSEDAYWVQRFVRPRSMAFEGGDVDGKSENMFGKAVKSTKSQEDPPDPSDMETTGPRWHRGMAGTSMSAPLGEGEAIDTLQTVYSVTQEGSEARKFFDQDPELHAVSLMMASARDLGVPWDYLGAGAGSALAASKLAVQIFGDKSLPRTKELMKAWGVEETEDQGTPKAWEWMNQFETLWMDQEKVFSVAAKPAQDKEDSAGMRGRRGKKGRKVIQSLFQLVEFPEDVLTRQARREKPKKGKPKKDPQEDDEAGAQGNGDERSVRDARAKAAALQDFYDAMRRPDQDGVSPLQRLRDALKNPHWEVREFAANLLANFKAPEAIPDLTEIALHYPDARVRQAAFWAFALTQVSKVGGEALKAGLAEMDNLQKDEAPRTPNGKRVKAATDEAEALDRFRDAIAGKRKEGEPPIPPDVPVYAAFALAFHGDLSGLGVIIDATKSGNYGLIKTAVWVMGHLGGITGTQAFENLMKAGKAKKTDFSDALERLVRENPIPKAQDIRGSAIASLTYNGAADPDAIADSALKTILEATDAFDASGVLDHVMVKTVAEAFSGLLRQRAIVDRIRDPKEPLKKPFTAFVMKYKAYAAKRNFLGGLVGLLARALDIPVASPPPMPDEEGDGVTGVDKDLGDVDIYVKLPQGRYKIEEFQDFEKPDGPESDRERRERIERMNAALVKFGLAPKEEPHLMGHYQAKLKAVFESGELWISLPDHKVASFVSQIKYQGYEARRAAPIYSIDDAGFPGRNAAGRSRDGLESREAVPVFDIGAKGGSEAAVQAEMERAKIALRNSLKAPAKARIKFVVPIKLRAKWEKLVTGMALDDIYVVAPKEDSELTRNGWASAASAPGAEVPGLSQVVVELPGKGSPSGFLTNDKMPRNDVNLSWLRKIARNLSAKLAKSKVETVNEQNRDQPASYRIQLEPSGLRVLGSGAQSALTDQMLRYMHERMGGLPHGYAFWMQHWLKEFAKSAPDIVLKNPQAVLAAFQGALDSQEKVEAVRVEAARLIREARERYGDAGGVPIATRSNETSITLKRDSSDHSNGSGSTPTAAASSALSPTDSKASKHLIGKLNPHASVQAGDVDRNNGPPKPASRPLREYLRDNLLSGWRRQQRAKLLRQVLSSGTWSKASDHVNPFVYHRGSEEYETRSAGLEGFWWSTFKEIRRDLGDGVVLEHLPHIFSYLENLLEPAKSLPTVKKLLERIQELRSKHVDDHGNISQPDVVLSELDAVLKNGIDQLQRELLAVRPSSWIRTARTYEIFTRAFNLKEWRAFHGLPAGPDTGKFFADFSLDDLRFIKSQGWDAIYLMGIFPLGAGNSPFAAQDHARVNPEFGTMDDYAALVRRAHDAGLKVIMDFIPNHTALISRLLEEHPDFFFYREIDGDPQKPPEGYFSYYYSAERGPETFGPPRWIWVRYGGFNYHGNLVPFVGPDGKPDTAQLNYSSQGLWDAMIKIVTDWVAQTGVDGFRVDMADQVTDDWFAGQWGIDREKMPPGEFLEQLIDHVQARFPATAFTAEAYAKRNELSAMGFDAIYNKSKMNIKMGQYGWYDAWMKADKGPDGETGLDGIDLVRQAIRDELYLMWQQGGAAPTLFIGNHDEAAPQRQEFSPRWTGLGRLWKLAALFTLILPTDLLFYASQEIGYDHPDYAKGRLESITFSTRELSRWSREKPEIIALFNDLFSQDAEVRRAFEQPMVENFEGELHGLERNLTKSGTIRLAPDSVDYLESKDGRPWVGLVLKPTAESLVLTIGNPSRQDIEFHLQRPELGVDIQVALKAGEGNAFVFRRSPSQPSTLLRTFSTESGFTNSLKPEENPLLRAGNVSQSASLSPPAIKPDGFVDIRLVLGILTAIMIVIGLVLAPWLYSSLAWLASLTANAAFFYFPWDLFRQNRRNMRALKEGSVPEREKAARALANVAGGSQEISIAGNLMNLPTFLAQHNGMLVANASMGAVGSGAILYQLAHSKQLPVWRLVLAVLGAAASLFLIFHFILPSLPMIKFLGLGAAIVFMWFTVPQILKNRRQLSILRDSKATPEQKKNATEALEGVPARYMQVGLLGNLMLVPVLMKFGFAANIIGNLIGIIGPLVILRQLVRAGLFPKTAWRQMALGATVWTVIMIGTSLQVPANYSYKLLMDISHWLAHFG